MPNKLLSNLTKWTKPRNENISSDNSVSKPGLNIQEGIDRVGGDKALYFSLLNQLKHRYANAAKELLSLAEDQDWQAMIQSAHTIKGIAGNLGAYKLFSSAEAIELIDTNNLGLVNAKLALFEKALAEVLEEIDSLR